MCFKCFSVTAALGSKGPDVHTIPNVRTARRFVYVTLDDTVKCPPSPPIHLGVYFITLFSVLHENIIFNLFLLYSSLLQHLSCADFFMLLLAVLDLCRQQFLLSQARFGPPRVAALHF